MKKQDIRNFSQEDLLRFLQGKNQKAFNATQIFSWIYKKGAEDFDSMSDLSLELRQILKKNFYFSKLIVEAIKESRDGTKKILFKLEDSSLIETVLIPSKERNTICLSSQVGCRFSCKFCASGIKGFKRNLSTAEIVSQVLFVKKYFFNVQLTHIVFMGTGEPLDNYENVLRAVRIFNSTYALNIGARRITISTSGVISGIKKLAKENLQVEISVSLHASDNKIRNNIMPINKKYPLQDLIRACRQYFLLTKRQITFEYILIHNLNCTLDDAKRLSFLLKGFDFKLNLIPYNKIAEFNFEPPIKLEVLFFQNQLSKMGIKSTLRLPRGTDINAACGQLRFYAETKNNTNLRELHTNFR
ncbi:MAG: 23S rRNA (adenine(2503)-C(2))-methyltransferase RlmN [Candidatus Omnitrophota bacterium]|nr:23S rRNA (adenine(2503)-C(2))-methyltransferase RlmN [Candidatus Omnitrophota bacterium]